METGSLEKFFHEDGTLLPIDAQSPILLEGHDNCWYIEAGMVEIFTVNLINGAPIGSRTHFLTRGAGQMLFGMEFDMRGVGFGFLVVGTPDTRLRHLTLSKLKNRALETGFSAPVSKMVDDWIAELAWNLTKDKMPHPKANVNLSADEQVVLYKNRKVRSKKGVLWIGGEKGRFLFVDTGDITFGEEVSLFPLTPDTWLEAADERRPEIEITSHQTESFVNDPNLWEGLRLFHNLTRHCKFTFDRKSGLRERDWRLAREAFSQKARQTALLSVASVLDSGIKSAVSGDGESATNSLFLACKHVGDHLGITIKSHPDSRELKNKDIKDQIDAIAKASRFRVRKVTLRGDWYKKDQGPMVATLEEGQPVALLPVGSTAYDCLNPATGDKIRMDEKTAGGLGYKAYCFYRPFPEGSLSVSDLLRFGAHGLRADIFMILLMAVGLGLLGMLSPVLTGKIFDRVIPQTERPLLYWFGLALGVAAFSSCAFTICRGVAVLRMQGKMDYSLQAALWDRLLNLPSSFFRNFTAGDLSERVSGVAEIRDLLSGTTVSAILGGMTSVFYLGLMFSYSLYLALAALGITLVFVGTTFVVNWVRLSHQRKQMAMDGKMSGLSFQLISGVSKIRVTGAENFAFRRWAADFVQYRYVSIAVGKVQNIITIVMSGFPIFSSIAIFWTLWWVQSRPQQSAPITTGDFVAFSAAFGMFQSAMLAISESSVDFFKIVPIYERLKPIVTTPPEVDELKSHPGELTGEIEASHLHFKYDKDGPLITKDVSFKIRPGEFIAFVGGSGSGKSTIMRLLLGFEVPEAGTVYYDGQDLTSLDLREVRQQIGVVLQSSQVLPGTIFENIAGSSSMTEDDAWEAARMAGLEEDIREMPMGMHTVVSEGGGTFSGGQRQRLMIARAVVNKPRILFFDEATSALDNRTQAQVTQSMDRLQATRIVIAHRLSTIRNADRIFVLDSGKIAESGTFEELKNIEGGIFAKLAERQEIE